MEMEMGKLPCHVNDLVLIGLRTCSFGYERRLR
jgi:hypothetical protein